MLRIRHLIRQMTSICHLPLKGKAKNEFADKSQKTLSIKYLFTIGTDRLGRLSLQKR